MKLTIPTPVGRTRLQWFDAQQQLVLSRPFRKNLTMLDWAAIVTQRLLDSPLDYRPSAVYLEYANVDAPEDTITPPAYDDTAGLEYYEGLGATDDRDYIRFALTTTPKLGIVPGYETHFASRSLGNKLEYFAIGSDVTGVHGRPFTAGANSKPYGAALVATPVFGDRTQDIIFARAYYDVEDQQVKPIGLFPGVRWEVTFG
jgi:hypothetical protein